MPPRARRNQNARLRAETIVHHDRLEANVIGIFQHGNATRTVEADIELARQAVERTLVEDVEVPFPRKGARVNQFLRIDASGRRTGDVANIVGARAARTQAEILNCLNHRYSIFRLNLAHLQIGARCHVRVAAGIALRQISEAVELPMLQDAVGNAQPAHIGSLRRRHVKQPVELPTGNYPPVWAVRSCVPALSAAHKRRMDAAHA